MRDDLFQGDDHCICDALLSGVMKLPAVIIFIVEDVNDIAAFLHDVLRRQHCAIFRLIKRPRAHFLFG